MKKLVIPSSGEQLEEMLHDKNVMNQVFADKDTHKEFFQAYGREFVKRDPELQQDMKTQMQATVAEMVGNAKTPVNVSDKPAAADVKRVSTGKGAVYNKASMGAQLESKLKPEDRFDSIGEYCKAIYELRAGGTKSYSEDYKRRLTNIREFQNSFSSEDPGAGGFLIPELMRSELLQLALEKSTVRSRATVIPMSTLRVPIPTVDDTSHVSSIFGGVVFYWTEEAASLTESTASFGKVVLDAKKLTGFFKVPAELLDDAPAFAGWFDSRVPQGLAWYEDLYFMTGTGVSEPEGFINSPGAVSVSKESGQTASTIVWENIVKMYSRMLPTSLGNAVWICAIDTFPQLATLALSVGTGGGPVWIGNYAGGSGGMDMPPATILGRPVIFTEKVPALGTTGDINFVDLSYYLIGDRQQVRVDASEHFLFQNNQVAYRIIERVDGRPWLQTALTPHNNSSNTLSAYVQLATRS